MARILLLNASVDIPVFNANGRSITSRLLEVATGGKLDSDPTGNVVVRALSDISFDLEDGDRLGIVGHNGAGKSTLLRVLSGVFVPTGGTASIEGSVGSLIDVSLGVNPEASGRENIFLRGALLGLKRSEISRDLSEIIEFSGLGSFIEMPLRTYSSGMQLRLAFAVATMVRPEILLMDEWLSVGDEGFKSKSTERLKAIVDSSKILVLASHQRDLLENVSNKVLWLEHGKPRMLGAPDEVLPAYFGN